MVFRYKSYMDRSGIGLSFLEPEKGFLVVTKTLQIRVSVLAVVIYIVCNPKWLQSLGVKSDGFSAQARMVVANPLFAQDQQILCFP